MRSSPQIAARSQTHFSHLYMRPSGTDQRQQLHTVMCLDAQDMRSVRKKHTADYWVLCSIYAILIKHVTKLKYVPASSQMSSWMAQRCM